MITRYEVTATHPDGRAFLIGYTPRVSRPGLLAALQKHGQTIIERCGITDADVTHWQTKPRVQVRMGEWVFAFTGRTQVECRTLGELPFIAERQP